MSTITPRLAVCLLGLCGLGQAMAGDYLPWELNDQARYVAEPPLAAVVSQVDRRRVNWRHFTAFAGWGAQWLGSAEDSERVQLLDPQQRRPMLLSDFSRPAGFSSWISVEPCNQGAVTIAAKDLQLDTPAGLFTEVVQLDLQPSCVDSGITRMWFARGVGLVQWTEDSLSGERLYRLAEGLIDGQSYPRPKGLVVSGGVPGAVAWIDMMPVMGPEPRPPTRLPVSLRLENHAAETFIYQFRSGQRYDILLFDETGSVVAQWSAGKAFPQVQGQLSLSPGESLYFADDLELLTPAGDAVPAGNYSLEIRLASEGAPGTAHEVGSGPPAVRVPLAVRWAF